MKFTKIDTTVYTRLQELLSQSPLVMDIVNAIDKAGGRTFLVGGAVRDLLLAIPVKDLDIEVHGLSLQTLEALLKQFGPVSYVGKAFGVLRLHALDVDWSLPRTDSSGRKPQVVIDPAMDIQEAFRRRDVTINAMGIDLITFQLIDPFNGHQDLNNKILRATDDQLFVEDPLRFYRVMQFIGRFAMQPAESLNALCASMDISQVSVERIEKEFEKLLLKSEQPSLGIRWLQQINRLREILPELYATIGVEQNPQWHPEGDVFEHTMQALDAAAQLTYNDVSTKLLITYAALCHDLGKVVTTREEDGVIISYGHDVEGVALAGAMLKRIMRNKELSTTIEKLVRYHMQPLNFTKEGAKAPAYKRLAAKLAPQVTMLMLVDLALADRRGRNPLKGKPLTGPMPDVDLFKANATRYHVLEKPEEPVLHGRDLLELVGPGERLGNLLKLAYKIQIEEGIKDKETLKKRVLSVS